MSGFHGFYSIGALTGAAVVTLLLSIGVAPPVATIIVSVVALALTFAAAPSWRREQAASGGPGFVVPRGVVVAIGLVCFVTFLAEGSMLDWSALFLRGVRGVDLKQAGWGFVAFNIAMTVMRFGGDGIVDRLGRARTVLVGGVIAAWFAAGDIGARFRHGARWLCAGRHRLREH